MNGAAPAVEGKLHRSRANRWEPQQDAALPGPPGPPPGPPQREGGLLTGHYMSASRSLKFGGQPLTVKWQPAWLLKWNHL